MSKFTRKGLYALLVTAVLGAGTVFALQLKADSTGFAACHGSCTSGAQCSTGCICAFPLESTTGFCSSHPTGVVSRAK
ncbi:MAG TPA: hypothetical protein VFY05_07860 [Candidatus Angelobacter sp.]|nr:hypothetical protein [Candidatus Angelobacter sp.]